MIVNALALCPKSWKILLILKEKNIEHSVNYLDIKNNAKTPLVEKATDLGFILANLDKFFSNQSEIESYGNWVGVIDCDFIPNILMPIRYQRVIQPILLRQAPDAKILQEKRAQLKMCLIEFASFLENHAWLTSNYFSLSDITLATAIAVLDYLGEIPWKDKSLNSLYNWYIKIKSRKSFEVILNQRCQGIAAYGNFRNIDF
jgi:glutathione S-transferase